MTIRKFEPLPIHETVWRMFTVENRNTAQIARMLGLKENEVVDLKYQMSVMKGIEGAKVEE